MKTLIATFNPDDGDMISLVEIKGEIDPDKIVHHQWYTYSTTVEDDLALEVALDALSQCFVIDYKNEG